MQSPAPIHAGELAGTTAEHLRLTEYDGAQPIIKIQAARIFEDHERFGFFRLGLAPLAVLQSVQIQTASANRLTNALASLNAWRCAARDLRRLEIRDLEISLFGEKEPRLRAATARPNTAGALELSKVSLAGGPTLPIPKATLPMTGPTAGRLRWREGAIEKEADFLALRPSENPH